jgi:hypothetical protein
VNINEERLIVLRSLSYEMDTDLIYDPSLPGIIRKAMADIGSGKNADEIAHQIEKIQNLYKVNGPPLIRCLLEYSYLLHTSSDIRQMFENLINLFAIDIQKQDHWIMPVINELNKYAYSPYDTTHDLIGLILEAGNRIEGFYKKILTNSNAHFSIRLETARCIVEHKNEKDYPQLIAFVKDTCEGKQADDYCQKIKPAVELLTETGAVIIGQVIKVFLYETHGPFVIASFEDLFHRWFRENEANITPSKAWVRVISQSWSRSKNQADRDRQLSIMINEWSSDSVIAEFVRKHLTQKIRENPLYLAPAGSQVKNLVTGFIDEPPPSGHSEILCEQILTAALRHEDAWEQFSQTIEEDKLFGRATAMAYLQGNEQQQQRIFNLILTKVNRRFRSTIYYHILERKEFIKLKAKSQLRILSITNPTYYITAASIEPLLKIEKELTPEVLKTLKRLNNEIRRKQGAPLGQAGEQMRRLE